MVLSDMVSFSRVRAAYFPAKPLFTGKIGDVNVGLA